jgi:uncharacterized repeat protein (TIGR02543 family)
VSKKKTFISFSLIVLFFLILSCENPMVMSILPDTEGRIKYKDSSYTVTYNANGGKGEMKESVFTAGVWENLSSNTFTLEGYVFTGWAFSAAGNVEYADKAAVKDIAAAWETVTLYAKWGVNVYTVGYDANGGEGFMPPDVFTLGQSCVLAANTFIREGYTFAGWAFSVGGGVEYADNAQVWDIACYVGETVILYAVWKGIPYTVEYKPNGGYGEMDNSIFTYNEPQELRPNAFILDGYVFAGWSTSEEGDVVYANEESVLNLTDIPGDTITLYAKWGKDIYTVSYVANGGSGYMAPGIVTVGQEYTLTANAFTREGYFFIGWSLLNNGEVHIENESVIQNADDITGMTIRLYAVWLPDMIVTWPIEMYAVYGQTLSDLWLPDSSYTKVPGTCTWAAPDDLVGNVGVHLHRMIFTPEDTVHYDVVTQDVEIIVYPKFINITGTPGRALIPFDSADTLYGKTSTLKITLDGLLGDDTVTLAISEGYGLSLSGNTGIGGDAQRTINVNYDGTTVNNESGPVSLELYISDNDNYILNASGFELTILDGQAESRAIPVTQANIGAFNSYANTESGLARHYKLAQNITDYSGSWTAIGASASQFTGGFDGNGFTISNFNINTTAAYHGIFGYIGAAGVIKNMGLINCSISGGNYSGGIAGYNNGTIQNCYVSGSVSGSSYTGGVAGYNNGLIQNCYSISTVNGGTNIGGVTGQNNNIVQSCYAAGRINGTNYTGGIVGLNSGGAVRDCVALNSIITTSGSANIGRVAGSTAGGAMTNNYARGDMSVKYNWNGNTGITKTITTTGVYNGIDGSGINPAQYTAQSWWITASNWYSGTWNFTDIWEMNVSNIPRLKTAGGVQNHLFPLGDGTEADPFRVYNEATLKKVGSGTDGWTLNKHYLQIQDIALPSTSLSNWTTIGTSASQFTGVYDGGGYTILNLTINNLASYQGLFGYIGPGSIVKNLGVINFKISSAAYIGGVVGYNNGMVHNCYTTGSVSYSTGAVGGVVGVNNSIVQNCHTTGSVYGSSSVGGVVGVNYGTVQNCYATGNVSGHSSSVGGVVGSNDGGTVQNCYATSSVNAHSTLGGVVGYNTGTVQNCYATGNVNGTSVAVGGILGGNDIGGNVYNCYATGNVNGTKYVGGVVGVSNSTIHNCSALNSSITMSDEYIGRVVGYISRVISNNYARVDMTVKYNWDGVTGINKTINAGLTTVDGANITSAQWNNPSWWQNAANWTAGNAWDFTNIWEINANNLPILKNVGGIQDHFVSNGNGTKDNPFAVYDTDTLRKVGSGIDGWGLNSHYRQAQDITLSLPAQGQSNWTAIGASASQFTGSFDGNGFTLTNLTINKTTAYQGIFGYIGTGSVVENIGLINCNIIGGNYTGGIAGYTNGTIQNCYVSGSVSGSIYTGGVAGYNNSALQNCYTTSSVSGSSNVGGVAGQNNNIVQNCFATGSVSGSSGNIGGVVGSGGTVRYCAALNPSVTSSSGGTVGRVLGSGSGSNNYSRGDMAVKYNWNGFAGTNKTISAGLTTMDGSNITASQWNNSSWWQTTASWNFTSIWAMNVNNLPRLKNTGGTQSHVLDIYTGFMEMVWIPAGSFVMGSPASEANRFEDEGPQHTVTLTGFYMGKYTVTQQQYQAVMGTNPSGFKTPPAGENAAKLPVEQVTWYDAVEFCNKLSQAEGLTPVYTISGRTPAAGYPITRATVTASLSANGYRLPSEAQWEYACRAGTSAAYYNGAGINNNTGWYNANSMNTTHEVGKKPANNWGLYDMHGNVWEWCWDWFGNYSSGTQNNPTGASSGVTRVTRGGSWYSTPQGIRSACRNGDNPSGQFANLGFRIVRP